MRLSPAIEKLVLHWGEMGSRWGINRSVAQIHALLYLSEQPLAAEVIAQILGVARSNVSNSLHDLLSWGVIKVVHNLGERRDHFQSIKNVWQCFEIILDERKRREMDPTVKTLREASSQAAGADSGESEYTRQRILELLEFFETTEAWYLELRRLPLEKRVKLVKLGAKLHEWIG